MRVGLTEAEKRERRERIARNDKISEVAELVATSTAPDTITGQLAATIANLACIKAWRGILADYR